MCGFIAQLVEHRTGIAEVTGSNPVEGLSLSRLKWYKTFFKSGQAGGMAQSIFIPSHNSLHKWGKVGQENGNFSRTGPAFQGGPPLEGSRILRSEGTATDLLIWFQTTIIWGIFGIIQSTPDSYRKGSGIAIEVKRVLKMEFDVIHFRFRCTAKLIKLFMIWCQKHPHIQTHTHNQSQPTKQ